MSVLVACTVRLCALSVAPFATEACVVSVTRSSATAAPTPEPVVPAVAFAEDTVVEVALNVASPGEVTPPESSASVCTFAIVKPERARQRRPMRLHPRRASLDEPAPAARRLDIDRTCRRSGDERRLTRQIGERDRHARRDRRRSACRRSVGLRRRRAVSDDVSVSAPVTVAPPPPSVAFAPPLTIVTATAAATETGPPEVVADGVDVEPSPEPPFDDDRRARVAALAGDLTVDAARRRRARRALCGRSRAAVRRRRAGGAEGRGARAERRGAARRRHVVRRDGDGDGRPHGGRRRGRRAGSGRRRGCRLVRGHDERAGECDRRRADRRRRSSPSRARRRRQERR